MSTQLINQLFSATKEGKVKDAELRKMQREALDFDFFSYRDSNRELLEAFGKQVQKKVMDTVEVSNPIDLFFDMADGDLDTELEFQDVTGGRVYDWAYGTVRKVSRLTMETWAVLQTPRAMRFREPVQKLKTGRLLVSDMVNAAAKAILTHKVKTALNAFNASYPTGNTYTTNMASADLSQASLDTAIRRVRGLTDIRAIVGNYKALFPIEKFTGYETGASYPTGYPESAKEEIHRKGLIGNYRGIPIVRLRDFRDDRYNYTPIAGTDVYLVPVQEKKKFNVFVEYGSTSPESPETHQEDQTISIYFYWEDGAALPTSTTKLQYAHRIYGCATS